MFLYDEDVRLTIKKYIKNPNRNYYSNILIRKFFKTFDDQYFSKEDAVLFINTFFEIFDNKIAESPELREYISFLFLKKVHDEIVKIPKLGSNIDKYNHLLHQAEENLRKNKKL